MNDLLSILVAVDFSKLINCIKDKNSPVAIEWMRVKLLNSKTVFLCD